MKNLSKPLVIAVDLDGVIAEYDGWKGSNVIGVPKKGAQKYLQLLHDEGWIIIIFTARPPTEANHVEAYLLKWGIPYDAVNKNINDYFRDSLTCKIFANVYLDDKAIGALGKKWNWKKTYWRLRWLHRRYYE